MGRFCTWQYNIISCALIPNHATYASYRKLKWNLDSVHLEIVLILARDRCAVFPEHTTSSEIILDALDGTSR
jgi:hypothetical protein